MEIPVKKLKSGFKLPAFGFGAYRIGGTSSHDPDNDDKKDISIIKEALSLGITHIDTAEMYAQGYSEVLVGRAIKGYDRSKLVIASKVSPVNLNYDKLISAAKGSLERLDTDYLDLYMIHYPNFKVPIAETIKAMDYLVEEGLVRYIGVSNFNLHQFKEAQRYTGNKIICNQIPYSLINRRFQADGFIDYAKKNDIIIIAWRPIEGGMLSGRGIKLLDKICLRYKKTPSQVAINWLISQKNVVTIPGSRNMEHLRENLGSIGWQLSPEDIRLLDDDFPSKEFGSIADDNWHKILK
jgi:diketogulonate reductase-like aldo/keto reductase